MSSPLFLADYLQQLSAAAAAVLPVGSAPVFAPPTRAGSGHYTTSVAMQVAKQLGKAPLEVAQNIATAVAAVPGVSGAVAVPPGFVNVSLDAPTLHALAVAAVNRRHPQPALPGLPAGGSVLIEYGSPNVGKPLHVGHLRNLLIGETLARLYAYHGYAVTRASFTGDWGKQFGMLGYGLQRFSDALGPCAEPLVTKTEIETDGVEALVRLYIHVNGLTETDPAVAAAVAEEMRLLEAGDAAAEARWQYCVDATMPRLAADFQDLSITIDDPRGERPYAEAALQQARQLLQQGKARMSDGAVVVDMPEEVSPVPALLVTSEGTSIYLSRDLASTQTRFAEAAAAGKPLALHINVVGAEQTLHFRQLYALCAQLGIAAPQQLHHVGYAHIRLPEGKMSTRKGTVIGMRALLEEAVERAHALRLERRGGDADATTHGAPHTGSDKQIGYGALRYALLATAPSSEIVFTWDKALAMEGNSAPYIQYMAMRARRILQDAGWPAQAMRLHPGYALSEDEQGLLALCGQLPLATATAATQYRPNAVAEYAYTLAAAFSRWYAHAPILKADDAAVRDSRLAITCCFYEVLTEALNLLGIEVPMEM